MPTDEESRLLRRAVERGFATQEQVDALLADLEAIEQLGGEIGVEELIVKKQLCTPAQIEMLRQATPPTGAEGDSGLATPTSLTPAPEAGTTALAGFKIISKIGRGGMGAVFKARQVSMDRVVALKVLSPKLSENKLYVERFLREARAAAKLDHPNIVRGIDAGHDKGYYYLAMEYVDGEPLSKRLERLGRIDESEALSITLQVARALQHAYQAAGIIHRDIKPGNVLLTADGTAKLADLGLAKSIEDDAGLTRVGSTVGTPHYVSPEQARGEQALSSASDIYSLGATLYHMLTGSPPFNGQTAAVVLSKHINEPLPPARERNAKLSATADAVVAKMLEKTPADRYHAATDLIEDLELALHGKPLVHARMQLVAPRISQAASARISERLAGRQQASSKATAYVIGGVVAGVSALAVILAVAALRPTKPASGTTQTAHIETPKVDPEQQRARQRERQAADELEKAIAFASRHEGDYSAVVARFKKVADSFPGTEAAGNAETHVNDWRRKWLAAGDEEFAKIDTAVTALLADNHFGAALKRTETCPDSVLTRQVQEKLAELRRKINQQADDAYSELETKAQGLAADKKFDEALRLLAAVPAMGMENLAIKAKRLSEALRRQQQEAQEQLVQLAHERLKKLDADLLEPVAERQYSRAEALVAAAKADGACQALRGELDHRAAFVEALCRFAKKLDEGARTTIGKDMYVQGRTGKVVSVDDGRVMIDLGGVQVARELNALPSREAVRLACHACDDDSGPDHCTLGAFWMAEGQAQEAREEFSKAQKLGADVSAFLTRLDAVTRSAREREAAILLDRATAAINAQNWKQATTHLESLTSQYADTDVAKTNANKINTLQGQVEQATKPAASSADLITRLQRLDAQARRLEKQKLYTDAVELWHQFVELEVSRSRMQKCLIHARKLPIAIRLGEDAKQYGITITDADKTSTKTENVTIADKTAIKLGDEKLLGVLNLDADDLYTSYYNDVLEMGVEVYGQAASRMGIELILTSTSTTTVPGIATTTGQRTLRTTSLVPSVGSWRVMTFSAPDVYIYRKANQPDIKIYGYNLIIRSVWVRMARGRTTPLTRLIQMKLPRLYEK